MLPVEGARFLKCWSGLDKGGVSQTWKGHQVNGGCVVQLPLVWPSWVLRHFALQVFCGKKEANLCHWTGNMVQTEQWWRRKRRRVGCKMELADVVHVLLAQCYISTGAQALQCTQNPLAIHVFLLANCSHLKNLAHTAHRQALSSQKKEWEQVSYECMKNCCVFGIIHFTLSRYAFRL